MKFISSICSLATLLVLAHKTCQISKLPPNWQILDSSLTKVNFRLPINPWSKSNERFESSKQTSHKHSLAKSSHLEATRSSSKPKDPAKSISEVMCILRSVSDHFGRLPISYGRHLQNFMTIGVWMKLIQVDQDE